MSGQCRDRDGNRVFRSPGRAYTEKSCMGVDQMRSATRGPLSLGMMLLAIWLILTGLLPFLNVRIPQGELVMAALAVAAGVLILVRR